MRKTSGTTSAPTRSGLRMLAHEAPTSEYDLATPVLILKTDARPLHHGTLGIIRSLGRIQVPVYASREPGEAPVAKSHYLSSSGIGVLDASDRDSSLAQLKAFASEVGRPSVIVAVDDAGALFLAENADALRPDFLLPQQQPDLPRMVASKANYGEICVRTGAVTPRTLVIRQSSDLRAASPELLFPAILKVAHPWAPRAWTQPTILAHSLEEAASHWSLLQSRPGAEMVVQEFIPHEHAEDWFYHGCHGAGGEPVVGFTGKKLRSYPAFFGATSYGVSVLNKDVLAISQTILRILGYAGIVELEFRFDRRDGRYKLIDFNPRLGAQFQFLRDSAGVDVLRALHLNLTGREVPHSPQAEGRAFVSDFTDIAAFSAYRRHGNLTTVDWLRQVLTADEHAWFAADDMRPFLAACTFSAARLFSKSRRPAAEPQFGVAIPSPGAVT